ncbi:hypothetical protein EJB05_22982, partial [Eragrostis curvula]
MVHEAMTKVQLLVHLLLPGLFVVSSLAHDAGLNPVVLLPGYSCSQLEARLTDDYHPPPACGSQKGGGWFRLWENYTAVKQDPALVPCYADQLRLLYDAVAGEYHNLPGVQTRVVDFGTTHGFGSDDPAKKNICMEKLVETLEGAGYREGENLFGAPYDFRYAPDPASAVFSRFVSRLTLLVERASKANGNKPVILVSHSFGGYYALEFLNRSPLPWRRRFVRHFVMLCIGDGGSPLILQVLASDLAAGNTSSPPPPSNVLSFANTSRSFAATLSLLPSPKVYGHTPLVVTRAKNYSAYDLPEFLRAVGFSGDAVARYRTRALPATLNFRAPLVPMTCINGEGVQTIEQLVYRDGDFSAKPQVAFGDGDGTVNLRTVLALNTVIGDDPDQGYFKSILIPNVTHNGMISDDSALKRVVLTLSAASLHPPPLPLHAGYLAPAVAAAAAPRSLPVPYPRVEACVLRRGDVRLILFLLQSPNPKRGRAASCGHGGGKGPRFQDTAAGHPAFFCFTLLLTLRVDGRTAARAEMASAAAAGVGTADLRAWKWVMGRAGGRGRRARPAPRPPPHPQLRRRRNRRGIGDKNLLRPQPRLRTGFFSALECSMIPAGYIPEACTSVGAAKYGRPLGLDERIKVDLIVIGLVAVDPNSGAWLGKGEILHCLAKIYLDPSVLPTTELNYFGSDPMSLTISTCGHQASVNTLGSTDTVTTSSNVIDEKSFSNPNKIYTILAYVMGYLISKRSMLLQYILQVDNQSNSVRALQSAHRISDNQQAQRVPGAHCQPCPPHLLPLEKWNWWEVDWDSLGEERELLVFVRALKMFRDEVLSRVNAMASALLPLPWKEKQQQ